MVGPREMCPVFSFLLAQAEAQPLLERLPPDRRVKVLSALAALALLGALMIVLAWLGGRMVRRYMRGGRGAALPLMATARPDDDWWNKPLVENPLAPEPREPPGD